MFYKDNINEINNSGLNRLFIDEVYAVGKILKISESQTHYLKTVMRLVAGKKIAIFNGIDGEWLAKIITLEKKIGNLELLKCLRPQEKSPNCWLLFPPIKSLRTDFLVEKSTEIGVRKLIPIRTDYSQVNRFNTKKHIYHAIEASEQCGRLDVPIIETLSSLEGMLQYWPESRILLFCDETGGEPISFAASEYINKESGFAVLVGPEGGFSPAEHLILKSKPFVRSVNLGSYILRTETAAITALSTTLNIKGL
tara:strand:- start:11311 stop:12069 length:759 start_codon:yes stop_codon:yes gene_type:complete